VIDAAKNFADGQSELQPLNPAWDHRFLEIIDDGKLADLDQWSNSFVTYEGGSSAHEIRTWVAAFAALEIAGPYQTTVRYYRPAAGLDALVVEKSSYFGGSTALSGGGIWVPGAPAQRREGYTPSPEGVVEYLLKITDGLVSEARIRQYVESAPQMLEFLENLSGWLEVVWKPGYADYYPELPGGSELGSTINVPPIDLRKLGVDEQRLLKPLALAP